jgi:hypothetical protein
MSHASTSHRTHAEPAYGVLEGAIGAGSPLLGPEGAWASQSGSDSTGDRSRAQPSSAGLSDTGMSLALGEGRPSGTAGIPSLRNQPNETERRRAHETAWDLLIHRGSVDGVSRGLRRDGGRWRGAPTRYPCDEARAYVAPVHKLTFQARRLQPAQKGRCHMANRVMYLITAVTALVCLEACGGPPEVTIDPIAPSTSTNTVVDSTAPSKNMVNPTTLRGRLKNCRGGSS